MSLDTALFLIDRGGQNFKVSGLSIGDNIKDGDSILVQRGNSKFKATYSNGGFNNIADTDLLLVRQGDANYKVTGDSFKGLFTESAEIIEFYIDKSEVNIGESYTVFWDVTKATSIKLHLPNGDVQDCIDKSNRTFISPTTGGSLTYTLKAVGTDGSTVTASASVNVNAPAEIVRFVASPSTIPQGSTTTLSWETKNAVSVRVYDKDTISTVLSGSTNITPEVSMSYKIDATGAAGDVDFRTVFVTLTEPPAPEPEILRVVTSPGSVAFGNFCPLNGGNFNTWTGNCNRLRMVNVGDKLLKNYVGTHNSASATILFTTVGGSTVYSAGINRITKATGDIAELDVAKITSNSNKWPEGQDIKVTVTGLW